MPWVYLAIAIFFEVLGTTAMKLSQGFTQTLPSILIFVFYGISFTAFTFAITKLDLSIAYAIWAAVGTAVIVMIGIVLFHEPITILKLVSLLLVIIGIAGLKISTS